MAEGARLESVYTARYPGFESLSLRQKVQTIRGVLRSPSARPLHRSVLRTSRSGQNVIGYSPQSHPGDRSFGPLERRGFEWLEAIPDPTTLIDYIYARKGGILDLLKGKACFMKINWVIQCG